MKLKLSLLICSVLITVTAIANEPKLIPEISGENFALATSNNNLKLWLDGRIQADGAMLFGEDYQSLGNGVTFRRVRLGVNVKVGKHLSGKIEADFSNGGFSLKDAFIQYSVLEGLYFRVGNFKEAFALDALKSSGDLLFLERPNVVSAFAPERHLGLQGTFQKKYFLSVAGIHFQEVNGEKEKSNVESNNKNGLDEGISYTARVVWMPHDNKIHKGFHLGLAASYRTPKLDVDPSFPHSVKYDASSSSVNKIKFLQTGIITDVDHNWLMGAELSGYYHALRIQGEYIMNRISRTGHLPTESFNGFYMQAGCMLFGGNQVYNAGRGAFSHPTMGRKWGDVEIAARFDRLSLNGHNVKGGQANQYTLGLNYYLNRNFKIQLNYSYIDLDKYANAEGKAFIGLDSNGELTMNPGEAIPAENGNSYNTLSIRFQLKF